MNSKDIFKRFQKKQCPHWYGLRTEKKHIYGCDCCRKLALNAFKKVVRRQARKKLICLDIKSDFDFYDY